MLDSTFQYSEGHFKKQDHQKPKYHNKKAWLSIYCKRTVVCGVLAKTSQSSTLFDLSWKHVPGTTQIFHHSVPVYVCE